jgi:hypothetical protein
VRRRWGVNRRTTLKKLVQVGGLIVPLFLAAAGPALAESVRASLHVSATVVSKSRVSSLATVLADASPAGRGAIEAGALQSVVVSKTKGADYRVFMSDSSLSTAYAEETAIYRTITVEW